jgi:hypothetical protein
MAMRLCAYGISASQGRAKELSEGAMADAAHAVSFAHGEVGQFPIRALIRSRVR